MPDIKIISAPSVLGLKLSGVEKLAESLLSSGLAGKLQSTQPVEHVATLNHLYSDTRDTQTKCLNPVAIRDFSLRLGDIVSRTLHNNHFPFVLGGDCSILIGIMPALKVMGNYGLIFLDAHADFYQPEKSITGEVADMDLAIVTGRGPDLLSNINNLQPYVPDSNVIHIGQRDWQETKEYGSQDIKETSIKCLDLKQIERNGIKVAANEVLVYLKQLNLDGFWVHFDTDVLSDEINPAVDYRLSGGLQFEQVEYLLRELLSTNLMRGLSVTIFNPMKDKDGQISKNIVESLGRIFRL